MDIVVTRTRAENQMETCGVHLDGTLFLPAQGRTPRVPVKAAKGSHVDSSQASSFIGVGMKQASYKSGSCGYLCIALGSGGTFALGSGGTICLSPVDKLISDDDLSLFLIHSSDLQGFLFSNAYNCLALFPSSQHSPISLLALMSQILESY